MKKHLIAAMNFGRLDIPITDERFQLEWKTEDVVNVIVNSNLAEKWFLIDFMRNAD